MAGRKGGACHAYAYRDRRGTTANHPRMPSKRINRKRMVSSARTPMEHVSYLGNQTEKERFGKTEKKPPACLSAAATKSLLAVVDSKTKDGLRHLAIMSLLYDSGCRVQELIDLNVSDFHSGQCSRIYVHGKGNKFRSIARSYRGLRKNRHNYCQKTSKRP